MATLPRRPHVDAFTVTKSDYGVKYVTEAGVAVPGTR